MYVKGLDSGSIYAWIYLTFSDMRLFISKISMITPSVFPRDVNAVIQRHTYRDGGQLRAGKSTLPRAEDCHRLLRLPKTITMIIIIIVHTSPTYS